MVVVGGGGSNGAGAGAVSAAVVISLPRSFLASLILLLVVLQVCVWASLGCFVTYQAANTIALHTAQQIEKSALLRPFVEAPWKNMQ